MNGRSFELLLTKKGVELHFGQFFHKQIWSPCCWEQPSEKKFVVVAKAFQSDRHFFAATISASRHLFATHGCN
jgi:hypothetical protein